MVKVIHGCVECSDVLTQIVVLLVESRLGLLELLTEEPHLGLVGLAKGGVLV